MGNDNGAIEELKFILKAFVFLSYQPRWKAKNTHGTCYSLPKMLAILLILISSKQKSTQQNVNQVLYKATQCIGCIAKIPLHNQVVLFALAKWLKPLCGRSDISGFVHWLMCGITNTSRSVWGLFWKVSSVAILSHISWTWQRPLKRVLITIIQVKWHTWNLIRLK